jgi:hypothetical protein
MRQLAVLIAVLACGGLAACASVSIEDAVPTSASQTPISIPEGFDAAEAAAYAPPADPEAEETARPSPQPQLGGFPNLNVRPQTAAPQFSHTQRQELGEELRAAQQRARSDAGAASGSARTIEEMRRRAREREEETLRRIEEEE